MSKARLCELCDEPVKKMTSFLCSRHADEAWQRVQTKERIQQRRFLDHPRREEFMETLEETNACPYCGRVVAIEPTEMCCSEVHGGEAWEAPDGDIITEDELREYFEKWLKAEEKS